MTDEATKRQQISKIMASTKLRAGHKKIPFDLTLDYLFAIAPDFCPVFKEPLNWGSTAPSLTPVDADKGYVKGNVVWVSTRADAIKASATADELHSVSQWVQEVTKQVEKYGGVLPPAYDDPAFTHTTKPSNFIIDTALDTRQRGGY